MDKKFPDWSNWNGKVEQPVHPLAKALDKNIKTGADAVRDALTKGELPVMIDAPKQPTNEQMFGHLVVTQEQIKAQEKAWQDRVGDWFKNANKPVDKLNKSRSNIENREWAPGKSFNDMLTEEELKERASYIGHE